MFSDFAIFWQKYTRVNLRQDAYFYVPQQLVLYVEIYLVILARQHTSSPRSRHRCALANRDGSSLLQTYGLNSPDLNPVDYKVCSVMQECHA